jgi:signal transduction histidine kinase/CheY-like chemotaxis protein
MEDTLTLLVVDDDAVDRMLVRRMLRAAGIDARLDEAADSAAALALLEQTHYDCVLLDYQLPGDDGLAVIRAMRSHGLTTPVVSLTGHGDEQLVVALMKAGATDYLTKGSLSPERLAQSIRNAVRVQRAEDLARETEDALRASVDRLRFLADASRLLASALDAPAVLNDLARLIVARGAHWCAIDLRWGDETLRRIASAARDSVPPAQVETLDALFGPDAVHSLSSARTVREGCAWSFPLLAGTEVATDERLAGVLATARVVSALSVPLTARGRVLGALTFATLAPARPYTEDDLALALDLGQRAATALDNANLYQQAQDAIQLRDTFLSIASHELKTPLTSLYGNAQLLRRRLVQAGGLSERDQRALAVIVEQSARLDRMISMLLDISRLQAGRLSIAQLPLDLTALIAALIDEVRPTLDDHRVELHSDEPIMILGDELRLHQVVMNLLQNAVKYSPAGGTVQVTVQRSGRFASVSVADPGIGIPQQDIPNLFSQFFRAANAEERNIGGIGLGLYVVNQIVSLHGGVVEVQSIEGHGSTFTVLLPLLETGVHADESGVVTLAAG